MKKRFFYASLLLAAATLNSCSQDSDLSADEAATAAAGALTPEQRAQVMELATSYGLDLAFANPVGTHRFTAQTENVDSMQNFVREIAKCVGDYPLVNHTSQTAVYAREVMQTVGPKRLSSGFLEENGGSFTDMVSGPYGSPMVVTVSWLVSPTQKGTVSVSIDMNGSDLMSAGNSISSEFYGLNSFTFKGTLRFYYGSGIISLDIQGSYSNGVGEVSVG